MKEQVPVDKLAVGMFVVELDRPWLETSFLMQGFVIESQQQIEEFQRCCKHVFVERSLSLGDQFRPDLLDPAVIQRNPAPSPARIDSIKKDFPDTLKNSFFETLRQIFSSAFSTAPRAAESAEAPPAQAAQPKDPPEIIREKKPDQRAPAPARREKGISHEERAYLERATDPGASVRVYTEQELSARGGLLERIARFFGMGIDAGNKAPAYRSKQTSSEPMYPDTARIEEELPMAKEAHEKVQVVVSEVIADLNNNKVLNLERVGEAVGWMVQSVVRNPDGLIWLARLKSVDAYAYDHGLNTAIYLIAFGRHLGLPEDQLQVIGTAGLMQDIGKIRLPKALLEKREKPTPAEFKILQSHVEHSIEIIRGSKEATDALIDVVSRHHERYDGSGYPGGIRGEQISMLCGMAGLVDSYTAMISVRPYAQPMSVQQALHELYTLRDHAFKSDLVEEFIQCVGVFPVGSLVELNTSEVAVVVAQNRSRRLKPRVMLVLDSNRQPFAAPVMLELFHDPPTPAGEPYRIVRGLQAGLHDYDPKQTLDVLMEMK